MAVRPEQLDDKFKEEVKGFEIIIDRNLLNSSFRNGSSSVGVTAPSGMSESHFSALRKIYIDSGWRDLKRDYGDQRDPGDMIIFFK
jgi:hypothetical protein